MNLAHGGHLTHGSPVNFSVNCITSFLTVSMLPVISTTRSGKTSQRTQTENDYRWLLCYSGVVDWAKMREIADSIGAYCSLIWRTLRAWLLLAFTRTRSSCSRSDYHHSQNPGGSARGLILAKGGSEELYKKLNSAVSLVVRAVR